MTGENEVTKLPDFQHLDRLQQHLHAIYQVEVPHAVSDFVTTDRQLVSQLTNGDKDHLREKLLVLQQGENLDLSLYLHHEVVDSLVGEPVENMLLAENLDCLCLAIEGISHFLYLIWRAIQQHEVSLLELELQAEVDKYIVLMSMIQDLGNFGMAENLHHRLFEAVQFDAALDAVEEARYREANHYAGKYCLRFERDYLAQFGSGEMFNELREFYRLGQNEKVRRIIHYQ